MLPVALKFPARFSPIPLEPNGHPFLNLRYTDEVSVLGMVVQFMTVPFFVICFGYSLIYPLELEFS